MNANPSNQLGTDSEFPVTWDRGASGCFSHSFIRSSVGGSSLPTMHPTIHPTMLLSWAAVRWQGCSQGQGIRMFQSNARATRTSLNQVVRSTKREGASR